MTRDKRKLIVRMPSETADAVLRRIERRPDYVRLLESDEGQALLAEARSMTARARHLTRVLARREARA